jgi:hypothetical protein
MSESAGEHFCRGRQVDLAVREATESAVLVAVPAAEAVVAEHRGRFDLAAQWGVAAHVTVLYSFVPPAAIDETVLAELAQAAVVPLVSCRMAPDWLVRCGRAVACAGPESPFRALTAAVWHAFPDDPPYEGWFDDVVPHLTIGHDAPLDDLRAAEHQVVTRRPIAMGVNAVQLMRGTTPPARGEPSMISTWNVGRRLLPRLPRSIRGSITAAAGEVVGCAAVLLPWPVRP